MQFSNHIGMQLNHKVFDVIQVSADSLIRLSGLSPGSSCKEFLENSSFPVWAYLWS